MGTEKRARQKANRQARLAEVEAEELKETREASTKKFGKIAAAVAAIVAIFVLFSVLGGGDDDDSSTAVFQATPAPQAEPTAIVLATEVPDDFEPFAGDRGLSLVEPAARANAYSEPPAMTIDTTKTYIAVIDTDAGDISIELYPEASPIAVNNFVALARDGYYDGTVFHRVLEDFMAQGGDPTGTGTGSPGYSFADEFDNGLAFDKVGLLAMANAGPNTNGSQFFITFAVNEGTTALTGQHTIFGEVVRNEDLLAEITRVDPTVAGSAEGPLTIVESIRIVES